jgi:hypothetical protein
MSDQVYSSLIDKIKFGYEKSIYVSEGWRELVYTLHEKLSYISPNYKVHQVKQKFGGLRFYAEYVPKGKEKNPDLMKSIFDDLVALAETASYHICETCGDWGELVGDTWIYVACKDHADHAPEAYLKPKD